MRICIVGLGAIGGFVGARLARAGHAVSAVARGHTLAAVREHGLVLLERPADGETAERRSVLRIRVAASAAELGPQDAVVVAVKTTGLADAAQAMGPLLGADTSVVSMMNGIPWWFFHGLSGAPAGMSLDSVDPAGLVARAIDPARVIGTVTHMAASTPAPGTVRQNFGDGIIVGEPDGTPVDASPRARAIADALAAAGFQVTRSARIQQDIWYKLWGNMTMNPASAITGATGDRILDDPLVRGFLSSVMREASAIGARIGLPIDSDPEERHAVTRKLGAFKTSMLQDVEAGRPLEIDALVGAVADIGRQLGLATPNIDVLLGLIRLKARVMGLYPG